jgi:hypothetical protein
MLTRDNRLFPAPPPRCLWCGYILEYLPEDRCPECGNAFDPDDLENVVVAETHIGLGGALRHLVRGTPLTARLPRVQWAGLITPKFPLFFALAAALAGTAVDAWYGMYYDPPLRMSLEDVAGAAPILALTNFLWTALGLLWMWFVSSTLLKGTGASEKLARQGGARVVYFSAWLLPFTKACRMVFGAYRRSTVHCLPVVYNTAIAAFAVLAVLRLVYVFQAMRKEPTGSTLTALITVLLSPDCWILILMLPPLMSRHLFF